MAAGTTVGFSLTGASGTAEVYVTTDGSDPRLPGGGVNPTATRVPPGGSISISGTTLVRGRQRDLATPAFNSDLTTTKMSTWSAPASSYYIVGAVRAAAGMITVSTGDGLLPLVEYALGSNPAAASLTALPVFSPRPDGSLTVSFTRALTADDAACEVQFSSNLGTWTSAGAVVTARSFGPGTESLTLSAPAPGAEDSRRYVRVRFTLR